MQVHLLEMVNTSPGLNYILQLNEGICLCCNGNLCTPCTALHGQTLHLVQLLCFLSNSCRCLTQKPCRILHPMFGQRSEQLVLHYRCKQFDIKEPQGDNILLFFLYKLDVFVIRKVFQNINQFHSRQTSIFVHVNVALCKLVAHNHSRSFGLNRKHCCLHRDVTLRWLCNVQAYCQKTCSV